MSAWLPSILEIAVLVFAVSSMLSVGLGTALTEIVGRLRDVGAVARVLIANFALVPLLALTILSFVPLDRPLEIGLLLLSTAAGAPFLIKLTEAAEARVEKSASLLVALLPVTVLFMPLVVPVLVPGTVVDAAAIATPLVLTMLLPLTVGLFIHGRLSKWALRVQPLTSRISNVALLVLIVAGLWENAGALAGLFSEGAILAGFLLIVSAFAVGYGLGGGFGFRQQQGREVLGLGTAQRNIAASMVVATGSFYDPRIVAMIVVTSLLALAVLFPLTVAMRRSRRRRRGDNPPPPFRGNPNG